MSRTAVVTGAAGFLGAAFADELRARGWEVRGVDLRPVPGVVVGDVRSPRGWTELLGGADLLVHTAAVVAESGDPDHFWEVNVSGTARVVRAAAEAGVARVLHLSSKVVYGDRFVGCPDEATPVRPTGNPYTDTKIGAEHAALVIGAGSDLDLRIARFGDVYGPRSVPWTVRPIELLRRRLLVLPAGGRGVLSPTYVDDAVGGGLAALEADPSIGPIYNITGGEAVTASEFFAPYADALGVPLRTAPTAVVRSLAAVVAVGYRTVGRPPPVSPAATEYTTHPGSYDISRIVEASGWRPEVDLAAGMGETLRWARSEGLVP